MPTPANAAVRGYRPTRCGGHHRHLRYSIGRPAAALKPEHFYRALALAVRDRMQDNRVASTQTSLDLGRKATCYLSAEFLMGPQLGSNLLNLDSLATLERPAIGYGIRYEFGIFDQRQVLVRPGHRGVLRGDLERPAGHRQGGPLTPSTVHRGAQFGSNSEK